MRISDWSSDVCSSDLVRIERSRDAHRPYMPSGHLAFARCEREEGGPSRYVQDLPHERGGKFGRDRTPGDRRHPHHQTPRPAPQSCPPPAPPTVTRVGVVSGKNCSALLELGGGRVINNKNNTTRI